MTYEGMDRDDQGGGSSHSRATEGGDSQRLNPEQVKRSPGLYASRYPVDIALGFNKSFLRVPQTWIKGGIPALMDGASPGLWRLFTHLWRYGNMSRGLIFPTKGTLAREAGFKTRRTLERKLRILETGDPNKGLPPVLERISLDVEEYRGHRIAYRFRLEGIAALQQIAEGNIEAEKKRRDGISKKRRKAGQKGADVRWAQERFHNADDP